MDHTSIPTAISARQAGLIACHTCRLLCRKPPGRMGKAHCPRCGSSLHGRKPNSLSRTWACILAASICYIPANLLPITFISNLGQQQEDTILSGVVYFIQTGSWSIALIIFTASIVVPLVKLIVLTCLLITVQRRSTWQPKERTRLYRITEAVGRWSMVDIFAITILVALVQMGKIADIQVGPAAPFFCAVVIITMFAALAFDPRLIWDNLESPRR